MFSGKNRLSFVLMIMGGVQDDDMTPFVNAQMMKVTSKKRDRCAGKTQETFCFFPSMLQHTLHICTDAAQKIYPRLISKQKQWF